MIKYYDERFGDTFEIAHDTDFNFLSAQRFSDGIGTAPIYYDALSELPPSHRSKIEELLWQSQHKKSPQSSLLEG